MWSGSLEKVTYDRQRAIQGRKSLIYWWGWQLLNSSQHTELLLVANASPNKHQGQICQVTQLSQFPRVQREALSFEREDAAPREL